MKKLIIILFLLGSLTMFAQDQVIKIKQNPLLTKENSIGIRYSGISGYGLSMQRRFADNYTLKFTGLIHYDEYIKGEEDDILVDRKNILYDFGFELQRDIFKTDGMRVSALGGIYFSSEENKDDERNEITDEIVSRGENFFKDRIAGGIGVSIEFYVKDKISVNFDFGYVFNNTEGDEEESPFTENKTQLGLGVGLSYLF